MFRMTEAPTCSGDRNTIKTKYGLTSGDGFRPIRQGCSAGPAYVSLQLTSANVGSVAGRCSTAPRLHNCEPTALQLNSGVRPLAQHSFSGEHANAHLQAYTYG